MTLPRLHLLLVATLLAACGSTPARFAVPEVVPEDRVSVSYRSIAVAEVDLPAYAELEEIAVSGPGGLVETQTDTLWADAPGRAVTLELTRALTQITGRVVAPEPWPFRDPPDAVVDVRVESILAQSPGVFRLSGQVFVAPDAPGRAGRARLFDVSVPYDSDGGISAIAAARAAAVAKLAGFIAREGLR